MMYSAMTEELLKIATTKLSSWADYATEQEHADVTESARQHGWRSPRTVSKIDALIQRHLGSPQKPQHSRLGIGARMIGSTALGAGVGTAAGYGAGEAINAISKRYAGQPIPLKYLVPAGTLLGGLAGVGIANLRRKNLEDVRDAIKGE